MRNLNAFLIDGEPVYVPDDELEDFYKQTEGMPFNDIREADTFWMSDQGGTAEKMFPTDQSEAFKAEAARRGVQIEPLKIVEMDDGRRLTLGTEDLRQLVQARQTGMPISRGMFKNTDIPEEYGKSREERERLTDLLAQMYPLDDGPKPDYLPRTPNLGDAISDKLNDGSLESEMLVGGMKAAGQIAKGVAEVPVSVTRAAGNLIGSETLTGAADKAQGFLDAIDTTQEPIVTGDPEWDGRLQAIRDKGIDIDSTIFKYSIPGLATADIGAGAVNIFFDDLRKGLNNGLSFNRASAQAFADAGLEAVKGLTLKKFLGGATTAKGLFDSLVDKALTAVKFGGLDAAQDVVKHGVEGADNPDLISAKEKFQEGVESSAAFEGIFAAAKGIAGAGDRKAAADARRAAQKREEAAAKETARSKARTRYNAKPSAEQADALLTDISQTYGVEGKEQAIYDEVMRNVKDVSVLDDPVSRERLINEAADRLFNGDEQIVERTAQPTEADQDRVTSANSERTAAERAQREAEESERSNRKAEDADRTAALKPIDDALREIANGDEGSAKNWDDARRARFDELLGKGKLTKGEMEELAILVGGPNGSRESIEVPLGKTGSLKVYKSTRELIQVRQNLHERYGKEASKRYYEIDTATPAQKLADPDFKAWARKQGRTPTDGARRIYDAQRVDSVLKVAKNWLKGVTMRRTENAAEVPNGARMLYSKDGNVVGWYDRAKKEVATLPGADAATVAHELGWHATYDYAQAEAAQGRTALLDKLTDYANNAPQSVKNEVLRKYGMATDAATLLDEIGAARYTMDNVNKIKDAADRRQAAKWYQRTWNAVADTYKEMLSKMGWNKARLDNLSALTPEQTVNLLADEMLRGKTLGKMKSSQIDMNKGETVAQLHDRKQKDRLRPIEEIEKDAGKSVERSAHTLFRLLPGKVQGAMDKAQNFADKVKADCKKAGIKIDELNEFLYANAASERNAKVLARNGRLDGSAMSHADIQRILSAYRNSPKYAELRRIADDVLAFQRKGFDFRRKAGLISDETWNTLLADEPNHVPMKSRFDPNGEHMGFSLTEQFGKPEWKTAEGRTNVGDGPLEWIVQEYVDAFSRGHENNARRALLETVLAHPEIGEVKKLGPNDALGEVKRKGQQGDPNVFIVKTDGDTYQVKLNGTRGELIARAVSGRGLVRAPQSLQKAMRWWSATATSWSPTFAARNFLADTVDVFAVNIGENGLIKGSAAFGKHVYTSLKLTNAIRKYASTGETTDPLIREAVDAGVLMGGGVRGQAFADAGEAALKTLKTDWGNGRNRVKAFRNAMFGWIDTLNQTAELMNRMADYKMQREAGKSKNEAALHAREITVDFNEKGELTPFTNMLYMFSNSTLGATMRLNKAIFASKEGKSLAAGMFAMGLIEGAAEAMANGDDEDGKNMNEYTRANSFYFRSGKNVFRIPLHASPISVIKYAGNCTARKLFGTLRGDRAAERVAKDMIGMMTSYLGIGALGDNEAASIAPTIIQPFVQAYMNRDFADRPIERTSFSEEKPKSGNGRPSTPQFYKDLATWLNEFGGGNAGRKGELNLLGEKIGTDFSPEMLKHFAEATGKNALRDIENTVEFAKMVLGKTEWDRRNIPVGRDYFRTTGGNDNRFFDAVRAYKTDAEDFKQRTGADKSDFIKSHPWLREGNDGKTTVNRLINMTNRDNPRSGIKSMGITQLRKLTEGKIRRKDGSYFDPKNPVSDELKDKAREMLQKRQARVIEIMGL